MIQPLQFRHTLHPLLCRFLSAKKNPPPSFNPPRGTHDTFHATNRKRRHLERLLQTTIEKHGVSEIKTPTFDHRSLFDRALGATTDVVSKEMYSLDHTDPPLVLRPEGTASVARALLHQGTATQPHLWPCKVWYSGSFYRRERPQKGRYRQFDQFGVELVGCGTWMDDVECIMMGHDVLQRLGLAPYVELRLNSLGDQESRTRYKETLTEWLRPYMDELSDTSQTRIRNGDVLRVLDSKRPEDRQVMARDDRPLMSHSWNAASKDHFEKVVGMLREVGVMVDGGDEVEGEGEKGKRPLASNPMTMVHDEALVRGLDYYCHTAFEFVVKESGGKQNKKKKKKKSVLGRQQGTVLAGGRYDQLYSVLSGGKHDVPAVGWALGMDRIALLLEELEEDNAESLWPLAPVKIAVLPVGDKGAMVCGGGGGGSGESGVPAAVLSTALRIGHGLRNCGEGDDWDVLTNNDVGRLKQQMKFANREACEVVVLVGEDELDQGGCVSVKNMATSEQVQVEVGQVVEVVRKMVSRSGGRARW